MKTLLMTTVAALFVAGTAYAEDVVVLIDEDADGVVTVEEWDAYRADMDVFGTMDADSDSFLTQEEYEMQGDTHVFPAGENSYADWDADEDGMLSVDEYNTGVWDAYDADNDDAWSEDEARAWEAEMRHDATKTGAEISQ